MDVKIQFIFCLFYMKYLQGHIIGTYISATTLITILRYNDFNYLKSSSFNYLLRRKGETKKSTWLISPCLNIVARTSAARQVMRGQLKLKSAESEFGCNLAGELSVSWLTITYYTYSPLTAMLFSEHSLLCSWDHEEFFLYKSWWRAARRGLAIAMAQRTEQVFVYIPSLGRRDAERRFSAACLSPGRRDHSCVIYCLFIPLGK